MLEHQHTKNSPTAYNEDIVYPKPGRKKSKKKKHIEIDRVDGEIGASTKIDEKFLNEPIDDKV